MIKLGFLFGAKRDWNKKYPFKSKRSNKAFAIFSTVGMKNGFQVFFANGNWYKDKKLLKAWYFDKEWKKTANQEIDIVYDYFRFTKRNKEIKNKIKKQLMIVNDPEFEELCYNKLKSYSLFPKKTRIKEFLVNNKKELNTILPKLKTEKVVLKPRYGLRGKEIIICDKKKIPKNINKNTIVQEFIDSSSGIKKLEIKGMHDLRILLINGKIDHCYARLPKKGCCLANCALGARKKFIDKKKLPKSVIEIINHINKKISKFKPRIHSIDFIFDKQQKPFVLELESQPGTYYYDKHEDIRKNFYGNIFKVIKKSKKR